MKKKAKKKNNKVNHKKSSKKKKISFKGKKVKVQTKKSPHKQLHVEKKVHHKKVHHEEKKEKVDLIESYELIVDGATVKVEIIRETMGLIYNLLIPEISPTTLTFLDEMRTELVTASTISAKELTDPSRFNAIKKKFMEDARILLKEKLPNTEERIEDFLLGTLMQEMLGLGRIEFLISDETLEEIVIPSAKESIRVYSKKYGWLETNITIKSEEDIVNYSNIIARRVGRQITVLSPLLDAHLSSGDRINAVLYPINTKGNTITIRKFARDPYTIIDLIKSKTCDLNIASVLWLAIEYEMNVLISGGTGSGKTSFLNACLPFIPPNQRIISIEDTRELMLPEFLYWTPLVTRTPNPEGKGEVSMLDLLVNSLRMRPDRIILGEMRKQQEAMVLFEAMHTGHAVYSTVHADSAPETISRLVNPPLNVPANLLKSVNLNVVMFRDRRRGIRRVLQLAEFEASKGGAHANILYRWSSENDEIVRHGESARFFEDLSRHTGLSEVELNKDLDEKKWILKWLIDNGIRSLEDFGKVTNMYYRNREVLLNAIRTNKKEFIFGKPKEKVAEKTEKKEQTPTESEHEKKEVQKMMENVEKQIKKIGETPEQKTNKKIEEKKEEKPKEEKKEEKHTEDDHKKIEKLMDDLSSDKPKAKEEKHKDIDKMMDELIGGPAAKAH